MAGSITCIPATKSKFSDVPITSITKRRVAAYARVSTGSDEQFTSYEAQIDYYTRFIQEHSEWTFLTVYTDVDTHYGLNPKSRLRWPCCLIVGLISYYRAPEYSFMLDPSTNLENQSSQPVY